MDKLLNGTHKDKTVEPGISGVMHGPYPKTIEHPFDTANGNTAAIRDALHSERITIEQANDLQGRVAEEVRLENPAYAAHLRDMGRVVINVERIDQGPQEISVHSTGQ